VQGHSHLEAVATKTNGDVLTVVGDETVSAIKPYEGFGDVDHTIKELMSL
jgi:hypothetical protein